MIVNPTTVKENTNPIIALAKASVIKFFMISSSYPYIVSYLKYFINYFVSVDLSYLPSQILAFKGALELGMNIRLPDLGLTN